MHAYRTGIVSSVKLATFWLVLRHQGHLCVREMRRSKCMHIVSASMRTAKERQFKDTASATRVVVNTKRIHNEKAPQKTFAGLVVNSAETVEGGDVFTGNTGRVCSRREEFRRLRNGWPPQRFSSRGLHPAITFREKSSSTTCHNDKKPRVYAIVDVISTAALVWVQLSSLYAVEQPRLRET